MRRFQMPPVHNAHPNLTPLIDVVMCLIVFFMLVAKIGVSTGAEPMVLPATLQGKDIATLGNTLTLNVRPGAGEEPYVTALVDGEKIELKVRDAAGRPQLADTLRRFRYGPTGRPNAARPQDDNSAFSIVIRGEEDLAYRFLEPVLIAAAEANVANVNFNTRKVTVRAP